MCTFYFVHSLNQYTQFYWKFLVFPVSHPVFVPPPRAGRAQNTPNVTYFQVLFSVYTRAKGRKRGNAIIIPEIGSTLASVSAVKHSSLESHKPSRLYTPRRLPPLVCCMTCSGRVGTTGITAMTTSVVNSKFARKKYYITETLLNLLCDSFENNFSICYTVYTLRLFYILGNTCLFVYNEVFRQYSNVFFPNCTGWPE